MNSRGACAALAVGLVLAGPEAAVSASPDTLRVGAVASSSDFGNPLQVLRLEPQVKATPQDYATRICLHLRDDSPEDFQGGAAFFSEELIIITVDGQQVSTRRELPGGDGALHPVLQFGPQIDGGFLRAGFRCADGFESIRLTYEFGGVEYQAAGGPAAGEIAAVRFRLLLANDYRIDLLLSDRFVATFGAAGNVSDGSNQELVEITVLPPGSTVVSPLGWAGLKVLVR